MKEILSRLVRLALNKIKELVIMKFNLQRFSNDATENAIAAVGTAAATSTITDKKDALIAELKAEISSTNSSWVKHRNAFYIALIEGAEDYILELIINKLAKL